ncbi:Transcriptional regulator WhiB OS=Streptomyces fumanus OX=67302 GN=whiB PE=3 SV=1 [Streptomyces fumanus]|uniref:Transcriptional regulator WhiB n=1 Tax=Streptomyces fumanus TaxID=67302 RepID=A0A919DWE5_9ACTN|nr:hypothetical protein GCM10018772_04930 [Streptomyces fumanus]
MNTTDWRDRAACRDEDPDLFFPDGTTGPYLLQIEQAKNVCRRCPVAETCLRTALDAGTTDGIFGGLTHPERGALRRRATRRREPNPNTTEPAPPRPKQTLRGAWNTNTRPHQDGHILWEGPGTVYVDGRTHTPNQVAFILDRGRPPQGAVLSTCGERRCVSPEHLADTAERTRCGTRPGYERHRREGTEPCPPCRRANADADNRLRWTGSTKAVA